MGIELGTLQDAIKGTFLTALQEHQASLTQEAPKPETDPKDSTKALVKTTDSTMGQFGLVDTIDDFRVPVLNVKLPWASAVLGIGAGTIVGNAIDVAMPPKDAAGKNNLINPVLQVVAAGMEARFLPGNLGRFAAGAHIVKLALRYTPLAEWLGRIEQMISQPLQGVAGAVGAGQDAQQSALQNTRAYNVQANHNFQPTSGSPAFN